jgi:MtN3 and saliva related transmembrane protein
MILPPVLIGVAGSVLLLIAWAYETVDSVRTHKCLIDLRFSFIYIGGNLLLFGYSMMIGDMVFITLQAILICLVASEIIYSIYVKKICKPRLPEKKKKVGRG